MALVKCKECGHEVSDKASTCPNCGCPIEKGLVCNECGAEISPIDKVCPNCGNPISKASKKYRATYIQSVLLALLVVLVLGGGFFIWNNSAKHTDGVATVDSLTMSDEDGELSEEQRREEQEKLERQAERIREEETRQQYLEREQQKSQNKLQDVDWLLGMWQVNIDGGAYLKISINESHLKERMYIPSQGEISDVMSYDIDGDKLITHKATYRIDRVNKRLLGNDGTPFFKVSDSKNNANGGNGSTSTNSRIQRLERKAQDDINELNAMVSSGRMNPATLMYIKQNLPNELSELMDYYRSQGNSSKYEDYAYKRRVVLQVLREIGI